jgi:predicted glutamine amidotransferase
MCQLLGMNCNVPTDICFSFAGFRARGGLTDHHRDGWGIAFFEGRGVRVFLDPAPSAHSPVAELVRIDYPIRSLNVIAHIRKATQGEIRLENTHPFQRELWGRYWIFAHNGNLKDFAPQRSRGASCRSAAPTPSSPSATSSTRWRALSRGRACEPAALHAALRELALEIGSRGEFNFLLSDGDWLFAHCSSRLLLRRHGARPSPKPIWPTRTSPWTFRRLTGADDRVAVIATTPLTDNEHGGCRSRRAT